MLPARPATLQEVEAAAWDQLAACVRDRQHAWRTPVLATIDGEAADGRAVVLREVDATAKTLLIYTDARAGKARQLRSNPLATLVFWSADIGWQLRCRVRLSIEDEGLAVSSRWAAIQFSPAAHDYLSPQAPGSPLDTPPTTVARGHFAVITATVVALDWLELHREGHRRAMFGDGPARWVQP
jgi:pyridoxamine 5'-phosphate oxidase